LSEEDGYVKAVLPRKTAGPTSVLRQILVESGPGVSSGEAAVGGEDVNVLTSLRTDAPLVDEIMAGPSWADEFLKYVLTDNVW